MYNGNTCQEKQSVFHDCKCNYSSKILTVGTWKIYFEHSWKLNTSDSPTIFICSTIKQVILNKISINLF